MNAHSDQNHCHYYQDPITPIEKDVIFAGRGRHFVDHPGNVSFNNIVKSCLHNFRNLHKKQKSVVVETVVKTVMSRGGRFLQCRVDNNAHTNEPKQLQFVLITSPEDINEKIMQSFRNHGKADKAQHHGQQPRPLQPNLFPPDILSILSMICPNVPTNQYEHFLSTSHGFNLLKAIDEGAKHFGVQPLFESQLPDNAHQTNDNAH